MTPTKEDRVASRRSNSPGELSSSYEPSTLVISSSDKDGRFVLVRVNEVLDELNGVVPLEDLVQMPYRIVGVSGVIDSRSLDHEEESLVAPSGRQLEGLESGSGHLGEGGLDGSVSVDLVAVENDEEERSDRPPFT